VFRARCLAVLVAQQGHKMEVDMSKVRRRCKHSGKGSEHKEKVFKKA